MEATAGIEPAYTALQAAASPLRHVAPGAFAAGRPRGSDLIARALRRVKKNRAKNRGRVARPARRM